MLLTGVSVLQKVMVFKKMELEGGQPDEDDDPNMEQEGGQPDQNSDDGAQKNSTAKKKIVWYSMEEVLELRKNREAFKFFCFHFLASVVGIKKWEVNCNKMLVSEFVTASDEAWALLMLEGNWDKWMYEVETELK